VLWERRLGGPGSDVSISIGARGDEVALVGTTAGNEGVVLLLRPGDGTTKWNRQLGRELWSMPEVALGSDGSVLVVGSTWSPLRPEPKPDQVFVVKLDSEGSVLWESQFGAPEGDSGPSIALHPSGDAILVGLTGGWDSPTRALMRRMDSAGTISWTTNLGNREEDHLGPVAVNARGDAFVVGGSRVTAEVFSGVALKVDPKDGRIIWRRDFADPPRYPFVGVAASNAGVYALAAKGGTESEQFVVVELGDGGQVLWEAVVTPAGDATGIAADSRGNVFVVGTTPYDASSDHLSDIFVTKIVRPAG
jgi:outer membrane protein assembly factor BamB